MVTRLLWSYMVIYDFMRDGVWYIVACTWYSSYGCCTDMLACSILEWCEGCLLRSLDRLFLYHCMHVIMSRIWVMVAFVRPYGVELAKLECGASLTSLLGLLFAWHYRSFALWSWNKVSDILLDPTNFR